MAVRGKKRLGDLLIEAGAITPEQLCTVLQKQKELGYRLGKTLISIGLLTEDRILSILSRQLGLELLDIDRIEPDLAVLKKIPETMARKLILFPIRQEGGTLTIAMADPLDLPAIDELSLKLSCEIRVCVAPEHQIERSITRHYGITGSAQEALRAMNGGKTETRVSGTANREELIPESAPIAKLVETVIRQAVNDRASDIHIEPDENEVVIRYRIDGMLFVISTLPGKLQSTVASRVKVISRMDIAETRLPQDGRFMLTHNGKMIEFRTSSFPTIYGENVVIRILNVETTKKELSQTGLTGMSLENARKLFSFPFGMVIATGPTGSGKTTTLYSALQLLNKPEKNIITVEDPVEYRIAGVRQSQINPKAGLGFGNSMRSILRQDPDIIMVGEIRDTKTAETAVQAAITGHLVLTTLHTTDAASAVIRLVDLRVERFMVGSALLGVIAQRLVRTICERCRKKLDGKNIFIGTGCYKCRKSGYAGRTGIFETLLIDDRLQEMISKGASSSEITEYGRKERDMTTMREDGIEKVRAGITTIEELNRVSPEI